MTISSPLKNPTETIDNFLKSKRLSANSQKAYRYDLEQFIQTAGATIDQNRLSVYEASLSELKETARKRKISTVNQFLRYLYKQKQLKEPYQLLFKSAIPALPSKIEPLDLSSLYQGPDSVGKLVSLLILDLGLLPAEILALKVEDVDLNFAVITVDRGKTKRVLTLTPATLASLSALPANLTGPYLIGHGRAAYSRQWLFQQVQAYLTSQGLAHLNAQMLRQQFILREIKQGTDLFELTKKLGLKSPMTLEKYYHS